MTLTKEELRDNKERLELWETYGEERRCIGDHLTHHRYCCIHCDSSEPSLVCHKEKKRHHSVSNEDHHGSIAAYDPVGVPPIDVKMEIPPDHVMTVLHIVCPRCKKMNECAPSIFQFRCEGCKQLLYREQ